MENISFSSKHLVFNIDLRIHISTLLEGGEEVEFEDVPLDP